ncbi:MAG TPA: hypothetical protein VGE74_17365 [Gemmata sp.]
MSDATSPPAPNDPPERGKSAKPAPDQPPTAVAPTQPHPGPGEGGPDAQVARLRQHPMAQLAAEIAAGQGLTFAQAAKEEPPFRGKRAWPTTFWRRVSQGVRRWDGAVVRLEAMRVGRRWLTSRAALVRFYQRLTPAFADTPALSPATHPPANRAKQADARAEELGY